MQRMVGILVGEWNLEGQSLAGVATERECEGHQKGLLQAHQQQKEDKGKCEPAAELGD